MALSKKDANLAADSVNELCGAYEEIYDELSEAFSAIEAMKDEIADLKSELAEASKGGNDS